MTKRLLSLVMALALMLTLFTGVAFAAPAVAVPTIDPQPATTQTTGAKRITIDGNNTLTSDLTQTIYYKMGATAEEVANPTANDTPYTEPFVVSTPGTYYIKAITYLYQKSTGETGSNVSAVGNFSVGATDTKVTINQRTASFAGSGSLTFTANVVPVSEKDKLQWSYSRGSFVGAPGYSDIDFETQSDGSFKATFYGGAGDFTVTATVPGATPDTVTANVTAANVTDFTQLPGSITVAAGESIQIKGAVTPTTATYNDINATSADATTADVLWLGVDDDGVNTFTVEGNKKGETKLTFAAWDYVNDLTVDYSKVGIKREVKVTVTDASTTAPDPAFGAASGKVFTAPASTVEVIENYVASDLKTMYSNNYGASWDERSAAVTKGYIDAYGDVKVPDNGSIDVWIQNVPTSASSSYKIDSQVVKATFKSEIAVNSVEIWNAANTAKITTAPITGSGTVDIKGRALSSAGASGVAPKDVSVTFSSDKPAVATVAYSKNDTDKTLATITGVSAGEAKITATSADGKKTATITVTVTGVTPDRIVVENGSTPVTEAAPAVINAGEFVQLKAKVWDGTNPAFDQSVTWTVIEGTSATVTDGKVVGLSVGTTKIRVASAKYPTVPAAQFAVTVNPAPTVVAPLKVTNNAGAWTAAAAFTEEQTITITTATDGATIYYTTNGDDPNDAAKRKTYTEPFKLSSPAKSKLSVVATKGTLEAAKIELDFTFDIKVTKITMDATAEVAEGAKLQMKAVVTPDTATKKTLLWGVLPANTDLAYIDTSTGELTAVKAGTIQVTATATDTAQGATPVSASCTVTITGKPVDKVTLMPSTLELNTLDTQQVQYSTADIVDQKLLKAISGGKWESSDTKVATVGASDGKVTAVAPGKATITFTYGTLKATMEVTVLADPTNIPPVAGQPTYKESTKEFSGMAGGAMSAVIGKITPATGETLEQMFYYHNFAVTTSGITNTEDFSFVVAKDGTVTMYVAKVPDLSFRFGYTVASTAKRDAITPLNTPIAGNVFNVNVTPEQIKITDENIQDQEMKPSDTLTLAKIATVTNLADLKSKGYTVTVTGDLKKKADDAFVTVPLPNPWAVAMDDNGVISLTVTQPAEGEYEFNAIVQAAKAGSPTAEARTKVISFIVDDMIVDKIIASVPYEYNQKGKMFISKNDSILGFSVPGKTVTNWKSSKPKIISVDAATGVAELKGKAKKEAVITATFSDGKSIKATVRIVGMVDTEMVLKYKAPGKKKFADFTENKLALNVGEKVSFKLMGKHGPKALIYWTNDSADKAFSSKINKKGICILTADKTGSGTLTVTDFRDTKRTIEITVGANAPAVKEILKSRKVVTDVVIK